MRLSVAFQSALAFGALSVSHGFVRPTTLVRGPFALHVGKGWENDNFLDSLSGGNDAINAANEQYKTQSQARADRIARLQAELDKEDESPGGSRFKELLEKAQKAEPEMPATGPILYNPMVGISPPTPPSVDSLSVEDQARMFREMIRNQQQLPMVPAPAPQRRLEPRKQGRNRDADSIANTADLYFAQLKRDSTVRTIARHSGDLEKANAVFQDPGVEELNHLIQTNPYLKDTAKQQGLLDTSADEMIQVMKLTVGSGDEPQTDYVPPSYKQKLMEKRKNKLGGTVPDHPQKSVPVQETPAAVESQAQTPPVVTQAAPTPPIQQPQPIVSEPVLTVPPPPVQALESAPASNEDAASEATRRTIRTLMGMILKHRGGPGFGSGRLKGAEAEQFESLLGKVTEMLRSEALAAHSTGGVAAAAAATELKVEPVHSVASPQPQKEVVPPAQVAPPATVFSASSYAITVTGPAPVDDRMSRSMACVEGAVQMYKNSPPEIQDAILLPLRAALMSAVNTCNQVIAEKEVENVQYYRDAVSQQPVESPRPLTPAQFFEVTPYTPFEAVGEEATSAPEPISESPAVHTHGGTDENTKLLQEIYDKLVASSGDGKFGLGKLRSAEAALLADQVVEMKSILIEELESGIPEAAATSPASSSSTDAGSSYQQMLAKAKAAKSA